MKGPELEKVVEKHLKNIEKCCEKIPGSFAEESIHDLRTEYKKLRAFLRLLQIGLKKEHGLQMPGKLKKVYHAAGMVRDLQLFIPRFKELSAKSSHPLPAFIKKLQRDLFEAKELLVKEIEEVDFTKINAPIINHLPVELEDDTIKKFVQRQVAAIHIILLAVLDEEEIHAIRKRIKDIIFNIKIFKSDWGISFPVTAWKSEKQLNDMASALGDFNDECVAISFLESAYIHELPAEEKTVLQSLRQEQEQLKEVHKQQLLQELKKLPLTVDF